MAYPSIALPRERDEVLMEIFYSQGLTQEKMISMNQCRVALESMFLSDLTTADGRYLEDFVFNPGSRGRSSTFKFPREVPTRRDWNRWSDFWHAYTTTGDKLKVPLGNWNNSTHRIWKWYYRKSDDDLQQVEDDTLFHYKPSVGLRFTRSAGTYFMAYSEPLSPATDYG